MVTFANLAVGLLGKQDLRHGLLAALYHDAAHPGSQDDSENTAASAAFWLNHAPADAGIDRDEVAARIMATSTRTPREARTRSASQLLHDADLLARRAPGFSREVQSENTPNEKVGLTASHVQQIADFVAEHRA